jgi:hypothetical protein
LVPTTIEAGDKSCSVRALLGSRDGEIIPIEGERFPPRSLVNILGDSAGEVLHDQKPVAYRPL